MPTEQTDGQTYGRTDGRTPDRYIMLNNQVFFSIAVAVYCALLHNIINRLLHLICFSTV